MSECLSLLHSIQTQNKNPPTPRMAHIPRDEIPSKRGVVGKIDSVRRQWSCEKITALAITERRVLADRLW